ncbi:MAG TPA: hypothetical protein VEA81_18960 [Burkholderiaceae bacterium]|nr:hypothetical protein [Burkholderiaceae bacterium]
MSIGSVRGAGCAALLAAALAGCGGDGAGGGAGFTQTPVADPGTTPPPGFSLVVSAAVPATGNGTVTGAAGTSVAFQGTVRRAVFEGTTETARHRVSVDYDTATGLVLAVVHQWGPPAGAFDALAQCVRVATVAGQQLCSNASVDVAASRASFGATTLRGAGTFASILTGSGLPFTNL